jgi:tetratricopeptide (TPR) repeat protein
MTRRLLPFALALLTPAAAFAQHFHHHVEAAPEDDKRISVCVKEYAPPGIDAGLPSVPWEVTSTSSLAKQHFQQGMALYYGFNYEGALSHFKKATDLDGNFVMGWWGMALAAGPNINLGIDDDCLTRAQIWSLNAQRLAEQTLSPSTDEYQLAKALATRYAGPKVETDAYADAMAAVWKNFRDRAHPDVGALYAESLMDKWPWDLWNPDGTEKHIPDTNDVLTVLRTVLGKHSDAVGANHYYIHAVEAGPKPKDAETSANFLRDNGGSSGHLRHMPSHTYLLMGKYAEAAEENGHATDVDKEKFAAPCAGKYETYINSPGCTQLYYGHYHAHDLFFRSVAESYLGRVAASLEHANDTRKHVEQFVPNEPGLQRYMAAPYQVMAAWGMWQQLIDDKAEPPTDCYKTPTFTHATGCRILRSMYRWARGVAYAAKRDLPNARAERQKFIDERGQIKPPDPTGWSNNTAAAVLAVAEDTLNARIAWAEGNRELAIQNLQTAVAHEDALTYDEPPQWLFAARQSLGGAYLTLKNWAAARDVFVADLARHQEAGRSLYGLAYAYGELKDPRWVDCWRRYETAWGTADTTYKPMTIDRLWLLGMPADPATPTASAGGERKVPEWLASGVPSPGVAGKGQPGVDPLCYDRR